MRNTVHSRNKAGSRDIQQGFVLPHRTLEAAHNPEVDRIPEVVRSLAAGHIQAEDHSRLAVVRTRGEACIPEAVLVPPLSWGEELAARAAMPS